MTALSSPEMTPATEAFAISPGIHQAIETAAKRENLSPGLMLDQTLRSYDTAVCGDTAKLPQTLRPDLIETDTLGSINLRLSTDILKNLADKLLYYREFPHSPFYRAMAAETIIEAALSYTYGDSIFAPVETKHTRAAVACTRLLGKFRKQPKETNSNVLRDLDSLFIFTEMDDGK